MSNENILIIDDDVSICKLLSSALKAKDYNVMITHTGTEGVQLASRNNFDAILVDLMLPDITGIQVMEKIKENDPDVTLIIITAYGTLETAQKAMRLGAFDYLTKPFDVPGLCSLVKRATVTRKLNVTNRELLNMHEHAVRLEADVEKKAKEIDLLAKIRIAISTSLDLNEVLESIIDEITGHLNLELCSILLLDEATNTLTIQAAKGIKKDIIKETTIKVGERISGWVVQNNQALLITNIDDDKRFQQRSQEKYYTHSLISLPLRFKSKVIGVININNKISKEPFTPDDLRILQAIAQEASVAIENARLYKDLQDHYVRTIASLVKAIDAKDYYTHGHSQNVTRYAVAIAKDLGIENDELENINRASQLHDLGKIGIHDYILTKPGKLTKEEWDEMRQHSEKGAEILKPLGFMNGVVDLVRHHHERFNGGGYPDGIKGDKIALGARIITVADVFDALLSDRPYRKGFDLATAINIIKESSGTQFDPRVVNSFLKVIDETPEIIRKAPTMRPGEKRTAVRKTQK
ncbi:MAG: HD domain-containing phosphohydrolase [bacterium]